MPGPYNSSSANSAQFLFTNRNEKRPSFLLKAAHSSDQVREAPPLKHSLEIPAKICLAERQTGAAARVVRTSRTPKCEEGITGLTDRTETMERRRTSYKYPCSAAFHIPSNVYRDGHGNDEEHSDIDCACRHLMMVASKRFPRQVFVVTSK